MNTNGNQQQIEDLIRSLSSDFAKCFKCEKKLEKHKMIEIFNYKTKNSDFMCSTCFKLQHKRKK